MNKAALVDIIAMLIGAVFGALLFYGFFILGV